MVPAVSPFVILHYYIIRIHVCQPFFEDFFILSGTAAPAPRRKESLNIQAASPCFHIAFIYNMKALEDQEQIEYPQDNAKADPYNPQDTPCFGLAGLAGPHAHAGP